MKRIIFSPLFSIIILFLLLASAFFLAYSAISDGIENNNDDAELLNNINVETSSQEENEDNTDNEFDSVYMSEGYRVNGGDLFCEHEWQEWFMTKAATLTSKGAELRYCNRCFANQKREYGTLHGTGEKKLINVKCLYQMPKYPNGCEVVSLTMVLNYLGYDVSTDYLIDNCMPRGVYGNGNDNPFYLYLGNPRDLGVGCYAPCIVTTADNYFDSIGEFRAVTDVSGRGFEAYKAHIAMGTPVIFWGTTYMDCDPEIFGTINIGENEIIWRNHSHCFVMIGYTDTTYIFCDPLRGIVEYPKEDVEDSHALVYEQACIIQ